MLLNPLHSVYISIVPSISFLNQLLLFPCFLSCASLVPLGAFFADPPLQNHAAPRRGSEHFGRVVRVLPELVRMCMGVCACVCMCVCAKIILWARLFFIASSYTNCFFELFFFL